MGKIKLSGPCSPYSAVIDTQVMNVVVREEFAGMKFITEDGEELSISMRDSGFEISYKTRHGDRDGVDLELKNGCVSVDNIVLSRPKE